jgi:hypothetical protein
MDLIFSRVDFGRLLPELLALWPLTGDWDRRNQARALALSLTSRRHHTAADEDDHICVNTEIDREQLREVGVRVAAIRSVPWKYQRFFENGRPTNRSALKIRPGVMLPLTINGVDTTARVNTVRRINKGGKAHFLKADLTIDTKNLPVILERETRCNCLYCGAPAIEDDTHCRSCGAPLPPC